jgi:hypothetical protein
MDVVLKEWLVETTEYCEHEVKGVTGSVDGSTERLLTRMELYILSSHLHGGKGVSYGK